MKTTAFDLTSIPSSSDFLAEVRDRGLRTVIEQALEAEIDEYLQRARSARHTDCSTGAYRNGTTPSTLRTQTNRVTIARPRVRSKEPGIPLDFQSQVRSRRDRLEAGLRTLPSNFTLAVFRPVISSRLSSMTKAARC